MNTFKKLNYLLDRKTKGKIIILSIMILLASVAELLGISLILPIVNLSMSSDEVLSDNGYCRLIMQFTPANTKEEILICLIIATIGIYIIKNLYIVAMYKYQYRFAANIKLDLSTKLMKAYLKQPYSYFLSVNTADLMRGVGTDISQLFQLIMSVLNVVSNAVTAIVIVIYLAVSNFGMTLTVVVILSICLFIIVFGLQKKNRRNGLEAQYLGGQLNKHLRQAFEGVKEIKIMNTEDHFISSYNKTYKKAADIDVKTSLYNIEPKYLIEVFAIISILGYLAVNILFNENYTALIPQLAVFCVAAFKLLPCVNAIYASLNSIIFYKASLNLVYNDVKSTENLVIEDEKSKTYEDMEFNDVIKAENVTFRYANTDKDILTNISIDIPKGKSVAFIGPSGGGKTTTADIVLSLLTPQSGKITVDGKDIITNEKGWRRKLGYIPQSIYLVDDTIRANVAFGLTKEETNDEEVWRALEDAQLKEFIDSLPDKLDTNVGERGVKLSGGQRQRIGIARALYRNPEVLVFDEATSALDNETEKEVMKAIDSLQGTKTMIMIAHRLSTIENCDMVYKVEGGKIIREK